MKIKNSKGNEIKYCKYCGKKLNLPNLFCSHCGQVIEEDVKEQIIINNYNSAIINTNAITGGVEHIKKS